MRKQIIPILIAVLLLGGCSNPMPKYERPAQFYYCTSNDVFDAAAPAISPETRECAGVESIEGIITLYLRGPESDDYTSPFPDQLKLIAYSRDDAVASVTFSQELASLSNLELTLACGCIAMTVLGLTDVETVNISAENALLNGQQTITMNAETLQLLDTAAEGQ